MIPFWVEKVREHNTSQIENWSKAMKIIKNSYPSFVIPILKNIKKKASLFWVAEAFKQFEDPTGSLANNWYKFIQTKCPEMIEHVFTGNTEKEVKETLVSLMRQHTRANKTLIDQKSTLVKTNMFKADKQTPQGSKCTSTSSQKTTINQGCEGDLCQFKTIHDLEGKFEVYEFINNEKEKKAVLICCKEANGLVCRDRATCVGTHGIRLTSEYSYPNNRCICYLFGVGCTKSENLRHEDVICLHNRTQACSKGAECNDVHTHALSNTTNTEWTFSCTKATKYAGLFLRHTELRPTTVRVINTDEIPKGQTKYYSNTLESKRTIANSNITFPADIKRVPAVARRTTTSRSVDQHGTSNHQEFMRNEETRRQEATQKRRKIIEQENKSRQDRVERKKDQTGQQRRNQKSSTHCSSSNEKTDAAKKSSKRNLDTNKTGTDSSRGSPRPSKAARPSSSTQQGESRKSHPKSSSNNDKKRQPGARRNDHQEEEERAKRNQKKAQQAQPENRNKSNKEETSKPTAKRKRSQEPYTTPSEDTNREKVDTAESLDPEPCTTPSEGANWNNVNITESLDLFKFQNTGNEKKDDVVEDTPCNDMIAGSSTDKGYQTNLKQIETRKKALTLSVYENVLQICNRIANREVTENPTDGRRKTAESGLFRTLKIHNRAIKEKATKEVLKSTESLMTQALHVHTVVTALSSTSTSDVQAVAAALSSTSTSDDGMVKVVS